MIDYCTILLNQATKSDILSACIQAAAAIHAGELQANAARLAGWMTFGTGFFALAAGFLAYRASTVQTRQLERQRTTRMAAYAAHVCITTLRARDELIEVFLRFKAIEGGSIEANLNDLYFTSISLLRDELKSTKWEDQALLGSQHLNQIAITYEALQNLIVEIDRFTSIQLPSLDVHRGVYKAEIAKMQCETLMTAIRGEAPPAMRTALEPVKLLSSSL